MHIYKHVYDQKEITYINIQLRTRGYIPHYVALTETGFKYKFVMKHYRNNQHIFGCCTGMTPWHGGGPGAVRL